MLNFPTLSNAGYGYTAPTFLQPAVMPKSPGMMGWIEHERTLTNPDLTDRFLPSRELAQEPQYFDCMIREPRDSRPKFFQPAVMPKSPELMGWIEHERTVTNPSYTGAPLQPSLETQQPYYFDCMIREPRNTNQWGVGSLINFTA